MMSEDVEFEPWRRLVPRIAPALPWIKPRTGRDGVAEFFSIVGQFDIAEFSVLDIMAGDKQVAAEIVIDGRGARRRSSPRRRDAPVDV